jgi:transcriptional regulator with XRE-family HTH domain
VKITICGNLKELRRKKNITQEELADFLTVSIAAVSKWERGECYPDMDLLPQIAMYYNVSVDDLLGVGKIRVEQKVAQYYQKADDYEKKGEIDAYRAVWAEAYKEFPNHYNVMRFYMWTLPDERADEIIKIAERLYNESDIPSHRYEVIRTLCNLYARLGNEEKAIEYAQKAPMMEDSRENLFSQIYTGEKLVEHIQTNLIFLVQMVDDELYRMTWHGGYNNSGQRKARQCCLKLYEWLYEDGDYGFWNTNVARIYADLAIFDAEDKDVDGVINNLALMAECAINFFTQENFDRTSFLVNRHNHDGHKGYPGSPDNECRMRLNFMQRNWFDFCRDDERFKEIEKKLEKYAN